MVSVSLVSLPPIVNLSPPCLPFSFGMNFLSQSMTFCVVDFIGLDVFFGVTVVGCGVCGVIVGLGLGLMTSVDKILISAIIFCNDDSFLGGDV